MHEQELRRLQEGLRDLLIWSRSSTRGAGWTPNGSL